MVAALAMLATVCGATVTPAHAASMRHQGDDVATVRLAGALEVRANEAFVFSVGYVDRVSANTLTLRFDDGTTETYTLNDATTIQGQNGDALRLADLEIGQMVIVLTAENTSLAMTIVSGGAEGFHDAGPADIRGHDQWECAACDAHATDTSEDDSASH